MQSVRVDVHSFKSESLRKIKDLEALGTPEARDAAQALEEALAILARAICSKEDDRAAEGSGRAGMRRDFHPKA